MPDEDDSRKEAQLERRRIYARDYQRKLRADPEKRAQLEAQRRERYRTNPEYRASIAAQVREYRSRNRDKISAKENARKRAARQAEVESFGNPEVCQCCGGDFVASSRTDGRCVDHRHDNGLIRGIVCNSCNTALATLDLRWTDPDRFRALDLWSRRHEPAVASTGKSFEKKRRLEAMSQPALFAATDDESG